MAIYTLEQLWKEACKLDDIEPSSKFVVFSKDNAFAKKYNTLLLLRAHANEQRNLSVAN